MSNHFIKRKNMSNKKTTEIFIKEARNKFGNLYDYSESIYNGAKDKLKIKCPKHGIFWQTPANHLRKNSTGCPKCGEELIIYKNKYRDYSKREYSHLSKEEFLLRVKKKFGEKFQLDLSNYKGIAKNKITVTCPIHGKFNVLPDSFICPARKTGCKKCGREEGARLAAFSYDEMLIKFNKKFDFKYEYPESNKTNYQTKKSIIDIICPEHGYFKRSAQKHSEGRGCHKCKINFLIENNIMIGGYSLSLFEKRSYLKNLSSYLYFLKINDGKYYKIGISKNEIKNRIKNLKSEAKKFNEELKIEILFYEKNPLLLSFLKEQEILNKFQKYRIFRRWSTELFSKNIFPENSFTHIEINDF